MSGLVESESFGVENRESFRERESLTSMTALMSDHIAQHDAPV